MRRLSFFHPLLFALFPILFLAAHNASSMPLRDLLPLAGVSLGVAALLWGLLRPALGSWQKASVMTSFTALVFFSYGHVHRALLRFDVFRHRLLLPAFALFLLGAFWSLRRMRGQPAQLSKGLAIASALLVGLSAARIGWQRTSIFGGAPDAGPRTAPADGARGGPDGRPDVYYVILDGYAGVDTLRELYGYDNRPFLSELKARGFFVADQSRSNYSMTPLSIASSTNMDYVNVVAAPLGRRGSRELDPMISLIENGRVMRELKDRGYKFVHLRSGYSVTARNRFADWDVDCGGWDEFGRVLAGTTALAPFGVFRVIERQTRRRILCSFEALAQIPRRIAGPRFVFAHLVLPEPPLLFGRNGEAVEPETSDADEQWKQKPLYVDQLIFASRRVLAAIDSILEESEAPPIIVLQSDHGSASGGYRWLYAREGPPPTGNEPGIDVFFRERTEILNAYLLPGGAPELYPSISPVNSFRVVFNRFFGEHYPLLEDRTFFSRYASPYRLLDVTARVSAPASPPGP
jgi:hypothetical protein